MKAMHAGADRPLRWKSFKQILWGILLRGKVICVLDINIVGKGKMVLVIDMLGYQRVHRG